MARIRHVAIRTENVERLVAFLRTLTDQRYEYLLSD